MISSIKALTFLLSSLPIADAAPAPTPILSGYGNPTHNISALVNDMDMKTLARRQYPAPTPGTEHNRILRLTACFEDDGGYFLEFASYNRGAELHLFPQNLAKPARDGKKPLWEGKSTRAQGDKGSTFIAHIGPDGPGPLHTYSGTALENFYIFNCYADGQHTVYVDEGHECQSIYYCKEGGPYG
jgi:hypothetical protein